MSISRAASISRAGQSPLNTHAVVTLCIETSCAAEESVVHNMDTGI